MTTNKQLLILITSLSLALAGCAAEGATGSDGELDLSGKADFWGEGEGARIMADHAFVDTSLDAAAIQKFLTETRESWSGPSFLSSHEVEGQPFSEYLQGVSEEHVVNPLLLLTFMQAQSGLVSRTSAPAEGELAGALNCSCDTTAEDNDCGQTAEEIATLPGQFECAARKLRGAFDAAGRLEATAEGYQIGVIQEASGTSPNNRSTAAVYSYMDDGEEFFIVWNQFTRHYFGQVEGDPLSWLWLPYAEGFVGGACNTNDDCLFEGGSCETTRNGKNVCTKTCDTESVCPDRAGYPTTMCISGETAGFAPGGGFCVARCQEDRVCGEGFTCQNDVARFESATYSRNACVAEAAPAAGEEAEEEILDEDLDETVEPPPSEERGDLAGMRWSVRIERITTSTHDSSGDYWDGYWGNYAPDLGLFVWISEDANCTIAQSQNYYSGKFGCAHYDWDQAPNTDLTEVRPTNMVLYDTNNTASTEELLNGLHVTIRDHDFSGADAMTDCEEELDMEKLDELAHGGTLTFSCGAGQDVYGATIDHEVEISLIRVPGAN